MKNARSLLDPLVSVLANTPDLGVLLYPILFEMDPMSGILYNTKRRAVGP